MAEAQIWHEVRMKATPAAVYEAITSPRRLAAWWIPDTRGESTVGGELQFWFAPTMSMTMRVVELEPDRLVRWRSVGGPLPDWADTEVEFKIIPQGERIALQLRHHGWREIAEGFPYYSFSWAVYLASLKDLVQTGEGHPFPNRWAGGGE